MGLAAGCGRSDPSREWSGRYAYESIGNWPATDAVKRGYVEISDDGRFRAVDVPLEWRIHDDARDFSGWIVDGKGAPECTWISHLIGVYCLDALPDGVGGRPLRAVLSLGRETKAIYLRRADAGSWARYETLRPQSGTR